MNIVWVLAPRKGSSHIVWRPSVSSECTKQMHTVDWRTESNHGPHIVCVPFLRSSVAEQAPFLCIDYEVRPIKQIFEPRQRPP
jgi:hypothetical protein